MTEVSFDRDSVDDRVEHRTFAQPSFDSSMNL